MKQDNDILQQLGRRSGMTVPEGYFADFSARMIDSLPAKSNDDQDVVLPRSWWQRCRPYIYMAAMFGGIWCMMKVFGDLGGTASTNWDFEKNPVMASALKSDRFYDDYYDITDVNEYELLDEMYNDGVTLASFPQH